MHVIKTIFLDKLNMEHIDSAYAIALFRNLKEEDLAYSNTGIFQFEITDSSSVILHFSMVDLYHVALRYDENIPNTRSGLAWYSCNGEADATIIDTGDENYVPKNAVLTIDEALESINQFFENPLNKPDNIAWNNADNFDWDLPSY